jgi:hypothetical protein
MVSILKFVTEEEAKAGLKDLGNKKRSIKNVFPLGVIVCDRGQKPCVTVYVDKASLAEGKGFIECAKHGYDPIFLFSRNGDGDSRDIKDLEEKGLVCITDEIPKRRAAELAERQAIQAQWKEDARLRNEERAKMEAERAQARAGLDGIVSMQLAFANAQEAAIKSRRR